MAWLRIELTEEQQQIVNAERDSHPQEHVRRKMLVLWLLHCGLSREKAAEVAGLGRATVQRYVAAFRDGGLEGLRRWGVINPARKRRKDGGQVDARQKGNKVERRGPGRGRERR